MKIVFSMLIALGFMPQAFAQVGELPHYFNFDGYLLDGSSNPIPGTVSVTFQIYNPAANCLVYEENHATVTAGADGSFAVKVGTGTRASAGVDGGGAWATIFQNNVQVRAPGSGCAGGYTPTVGDARKLRVTVGGTTLTPDYTIGSVPFAQTAETLQGKTASQFVSTTGDSYVTGNIQMQSYGELRLNGAGGYYTGFRGPPSLPSNTVYTMPTAPGSNGQCLATDGANNLVWQTVAAPGSSITSLNGLTNAAQTFVMGTAGLSPAWSSSGAIHTLNIPNANTASVTAGLLSYADFMTFMNKMPTVTGTLNSVMRYDGTNWVSTNGLSIDNTGLVVLQNNPASNMHAVTKQYVDTLTSNSVDKNGDDMNGNLQFMNMGNPSSATVSFGGSPNNGIYSATGGMDVSIASNGSEKMRVTPGGVGFGTTNPTATVEVGSGGFKVGPSGMGSTVSWIKNFPGLNCAGFVSIAPGATGSCTATLTSAPLMDNISLNCLPENAAPAYPMVHSCYLTANNQLTITVLNAGISSMTPPTYWNVTMTKF